MLNAQFIPTYFYSLCKIDIRILYYVSITNISTLFGTLQTQMRKFQGPGTKSQTMTTFPTRLSSSLSCHTLIRPVVAVGSWKSAWEKIRTCGGKNNSFKQRVVYCEVSITVPQDQSFDVTLLLRSCAKVSQPAGGRSVLLKGHNNADFCSK